MIDEAERGLFAWALDAAAPCVEIGLFGGMAAWGREAGGAHGCWRI